MSAWAALVERLIAAGHPDPLQYTPEQAVAFDRLAQVRRKAERQDAYLIARNAAHAPKEVDEEFRKQLGIGD